MNIIDKTIARIEEALTETKNPCKNYATKEAAEKMAAEEARIRAEERVKAEEDRKATAKAQAEAEAILAAERAKQATELAAQQKQYDKALAGQPDVIHAVCGDPAYAEPCKNESDAECGECLAHIPAASVVGLKPRRPTRNELIGAVAASYRVSILTADEWLRTEFSQEQAAA